MFANVRDASHMQFMFAANILVAGVVGFSALFLARGSSNPVFSNIENVSEATRICGAFWLAVALLSVMGLTAPEKFAAILWMQLIYKGSYLLFSYLPQMLMGKRNLPHAMAVFFLAWVVCIPVALHFG